MHDYFYGVEAEQFSFYRIPKVLFTNKEFHSVSIEAKILYGIFLDRLCLSAKNGWMDEQRRVYIIYQISDLMTDFGFSDQKIGKLLTELEEKAGLIERKRQGLGKPNLIYVKNFISKPESQIKNTQNHDSTIPEITNQESPKSRFNIYSINKTNYSDTDSSETLSYLINPLLGEKITFQGDDKIDEMDETEKTEKTEKTDRMREREIYQSIIEENIAYENLKFDYPHDLGLLEGIRDLMVDAVCSTQSEIKIAGDSKPAAVVRSQFLKLDDTHIRYVIDGLDKNTTKVKNFRQYMLSALFYSPMTIDGHFKAWYNHDREFPPN